MRAIIRAGFLCAAVGAFAIGDGLTVTLDPAGALTAGFDDRSAPSSYQLDTPPYSGWVSVGTVEIVGVNQFDAVGGSDLIKTVSCVWRGVADGSTQRVYVWQDDGSGVFSNARLLAEQSVIVANAGTTVANSYALTVPVPVTGRFYVGFSSIWSSGTGVCAFQLVPLGSVPDLAMVGARTPPFDPSNSSHLASINSVVSHGFSGAFAVRADGSGGAFSYQGRLAAGGANYTGNADFIFTVCNKAVGAGVIGKSLAMTNVPVIAGVFSVSIPADPEWFVNNPDPYLDVQVRTPAGGGAYETLHPRARIGQVPAAMVATLAQSSLSVPWTGVTGAPEFFQPWSAVPGGIATSGERVGINTTTPETEFEVAGDISVQNTNTLRARNTAGAMETWMWPRWSDDWMYTNFGSNGWHIRNNSLTEVMTMLPNGYVGVGANPPSCPLHVSSTVGVVTQIESSNTTGTWFNLRNSSAGGTYWRLISTGSGNGEGAGKLIIGNGPSAGSNGDVVTFMTNGRVGIGITTPDQVLSVNGNASKTGGGSWATLSDPRVKHDIVPMHGTLDRLLSLRGYEYFYNEDAVTSGRALPGRQCGLLADDVERVFPDWVSRDDEGMRMVTERSTTALMVEALRDLRAEKDEQIRRRDEQIDSQGREIEDLKARLKHIEEMLKSR